MMHNHHNRHDNLFHTGASAFGSDETHTGLMTQTQKENDQEARRRTITIHVKYGRVKGQREVRGNSCVEFRGSLMGRSYVTTTTTTCMMHIYIPGILQYYSGHRGDVTDATSATRHPEACNLQHKRPRTCSSPVNPVGHIQPYDYSYFQYQ